MLFLRTGLPGASKTLNTLREITHDSKSAGREIYYHNIKLLMLDFEVCSSFAGYFYGSYLPSLDKKTRIPVDKRLKKLHEQGELADLKNFPHLEQTFDAWLASKGDVLLWLYWVRVCYPDSARENLRLFLDSAEKELVTVETLKQFNLDWRRFDSPSRWYELPRQSIIVMDECQQTFPPRPVGAKVPLHCSEFETHRHKGWDIHLVTQDAKLLDNHVRRLAGCHVHYFNPFKSNRVTRYQADKVFDQDDYFQKKQTISSVITRDKSMYGLYWSADAHTHKLVIPKKLVLALFIPFLVAFLVYRIVSGSWLSSTTPTPSSSSSSSSSGSQANSSQANSSQANSSQVNSQKVDLLPGQIDTRPYSQLAAETPIGKLCTQLAYAGFELKKTNYGTYSVVHFFSCELPYDKAESKDDEDFVKPSLLVDGSYMNRLGFDFEFLNRMPVLTYNGTQYIFPRY